MNDPFRGFTAIFYKEVLHMRRDSFAMLFALIVPIVRANVNMGNNSYSVSMSVQAIGAGAKIVAERPMYFNYYGDQGGTDVIGYTG